MDDINKDYPLDESSESVPEETPSEADKPSEEEKSKEEKFVPEARFAQVYGKMKGLEREITELKTQKTDGKFTPEQEKELQAKQYLSGLMKETLAEVEKAKADAEAAELVKFKDEVNEILESNTDVKRSEFMDFLEKEGNDYSSVASAMKGYKRLNDTAKTAAEKAKKAKDNKPSIPSSEGSGGYNSELSKEDKGKDFWEIANEAIKSVGKK